MSEKLLAPVTPGEILLEEYLVPLEMSQNELARRLGVPANRINQIVNGRRAITAETALLLGKFFSTSPEFWLGLQNDYDLEIARRALAGDLSSLTPLSIGIGK